MLGEFDGVRRIVEQRLLQPRRVAAQMGGVEPRFDTQLDVSCLGAVGDDGGDVVEQAVDGQRRFVENEFPGLDLGDVEDVVDDLQEVRNRGVDLVQPLGLRWRDAVAPEDVHHAGDAIQGCADFVAHVGEEAALGPVGRLGDVARGDERLFGFLALRDVGDEGDVARRAVVLPGKEMHDDFDREHAPVLGDVHRFEL